MQHRIRAAGLLVRDNTVLLIKHTMNGRTFWVPPGGGLEIVDATTRDTVVREVKEEAGLDVTSVGELVYVREFKSLSENTYHMEQFFRVTEWQGELTLANLAGLGGDEHMISEARFVHRDELASMRVYPKELADDLWARIEQPIIHPLHLGVQVEGDDADF
ncbi:MAG: NUDIX domain-containing protein [Reinekea sp.]|nr:NUDIX domain-containing protein [Reinekea sp.]